MHEVFLISFGSFVSSKFQHARYNQDVQMYFMILVLIGVHKIKSKHNRFKRTLFIGTNHKLNILE